MAEPTVSVGAVLDSGFRLFREHWRALLPVSIVASIVGQLGQLMQLAVAPTEGAQQPEVGAGLWLVLLAFFVISILTYGMLIVAVHDRAEGRPGSIGTTLVAAARRLPALLGTTLCVTLAVAIGLLLLVVPGIYLMVAASQAYFLLLLEGAGPIEAISGSRQLVQGRWWRTVLLLSVAGIIYGLAVTIPGLVVGVVAGLTGSLTGALDGATVTMLLIAALVTAPILPIGATLWYAIYRDLRTRSQGDDLRARLEKATA